MNKAERIITTIDSRIDNRLPQSPEAVRRRKNRLLRPIAAIAMTGALIGGAKVVHEAIEAPHFSESTTTYVLDQGDGMYDAVQEIEGIETIDMRDAADYVEDLPANQDVLEDGLQVGEALEIPTNVVSK